MDATTAVKKINSLHFMPGWRISAQQEGRLVRITCEIDTVNSDRENALKGYPQHITIAPSAVSDVSGVRNDDELYAGVLGFILELFTHEAREFLRVGDDMDAPFHPHRLLGVARWEEVTA